MSYDYENYWNNRREAIREGARRGGVAGMKAAERSWNMQHRATPHRESAPQQFIKDNEGRRVELIYTDDPYTKLKPGDKGTYQLLITQTIMENQHCIQWDNGSTLSLLEGKDQFKFIEE